MEFRTSIVDADGVDHLYTCESFAWDESIHLQLELGKITGGVAGPTVEFAASLFTMASEVEGDDDDSPELDKLSPRAIGDAITSLATGIMAAGGPAFIRRIFATTKRETDLAGNGTDKTLVSLTDGGVLDMAYTAGNNVEMYKALAWVLACNFSLFGRSGSLDWIKLSDKLLKLMPIQLTQSTGTATPSDEPSPATIEPTS